MFPHIVVSDVPKWNAEASAREYTHELNTNQPCHDRFTLSADTEPLNICEIQKN